MNEYDDLDDDDANGNGEQDRQSHRQPTTVNARIFQLEYGLFVIVLVALVPLNIPCMFQFCLLYSFIFVYFFSPNFILFYFLILVVFFLF